MSERLPERAALVALALGSLAVALAAAPYALFDLDRHAVPKELVLHLTALAAGTPLLWARRPAAERVDRWLALWLAASAGAFLFATNHWLALRAFAVSLSGLVCYWSARQVTRAGLQRPLLRAIALAAVLAVFTGLLQAYGVEYALASLSRAPGGTFGNRNFLAHAAALALPVTLWVALEAPGRRAAALAIAGVLFIAALLVLSRSRAAWLGAGAGTAVLGLCWLLRAAPPIRGPLRGRLLVTAFALAVGAVTALTVPNALNWRSDAPYVESLKGIANYREGSGHGRLVQYRNTLGMVRDDPVFGVGPGNWAVAYPRYTTPGDPAFVTTAVIPTNPWPSSDWVALLAERGVPAMLFYFGAALQLLVLAWRAARDPAQPRRLDAWCGAALLVTLFVIGCFDAVQLLAPANVLSLSALGALVPVPDDDRRRETGPRLRMALRLGVPLVLALAAFRSAAQWVAMDLWTGARTIATQERAARWDPANFRIRMSLAGAWLARGRTEEGCAHARAALALQPWNEPARRRARRCGIAVR